MSGWTFVVTKKKVKARTKTVRASCGDEAIDIAKRRDEGWDDPSIFYEYEAREVFDENTDYI
jgi:hypothetical protein